MPNHKPPQARRTIKVALKAIVDPELTTSQRSTVKEYFGQRCAFCDRELSGTRAHLDQLLPVAKGGTNQLSNRVLSCASCNGDKKLDRDWREHLREVTLDENAYRERKNRILAWVDRKRKGEPAVSREQQELLTRETERVLAEFDLAVDRLRSAASEQR